MNPEQTRPDQISAGQSAQAPAEEGRSAWRDPAAPEEPDSDRAGGSGNTDIANDTPKPDAGGDASSHGSR